MNDREPSSGDLSFSSIEIYNKAEGKLVNTEYIAAISQLYENTPITFTSRKQEGIYVKYLDRTDGLYEI